MAGESARREYERRRANDALRRRRALPIAVTLVAFMAVAGLILGEHLWPGSGGTVALVTATLTGLKLATDLGPRQTTTAWRTGAAGERAVAAVLDGLAGVRALHDRQVPGKRSNIDHVAVAMSGVFTVDAKQYKGKLTVRRGVMRVAGRDTTKLLDQARMQAAVAAAVLDGHPAGRHIQPVLCFVGTELPRRHTVVGGVHVVTRRGLAQLLSRSPAVLTPAQVLEARALLDAQLVPA